MRSSSSVLLPLVAAVLAAGCNSPASSGAPAGSAAATTAAASTSAAAKTTSAVTVSTAVPPPVDGPPRPAATSHRAGAEPLTDAEKGELEGKCKPFAEAVMKAGEKKPGDKHAPQLEDVIAHPPDVSGVDAARCGGLMLRAYRADLAQKNEKEALASLKAIAAAMTTPKLCESAGPVPANVADVDDKKYMSAPKDWDGAGWKCLKFSMTDPQRYQYEVKTDAAKQTFRVTAKGQPFKGAGFSELFVEGHVEKGKVVVGEVMRK